MSGATWPIFENCFCFFEQEGVFYDFKVTKNKMRTKKIFDLIDWTGLYAQNCRNYTTFYRFGHTGTMVTRYTGGVSQFPVVEMSWGKKSKKKTSGLSNFCFLVNFIRHIGPMVTIVTSCTGNLYQLPVVDMSWGKSLRKNQVFWPTFIFWSISSHTLVPWSPWSPGA